MRTAYTLLFYCLLPFILLRLLWRSIAAPAYARRWPERFGFFSPLNSTRKVVWLHTVSVGEFLAALPLIRRLQTDERLQLVITATTPTGSERVRSILGDSVFHVYAPYDVPDAIARFIRRVNPSLYLIMETELWPNTVATCARQKIPVFLINGRLSAKSARGYARFNGLTRPMLRDLSCALIQNDTDAARFMALGLVPTQVRVTGNIKFDLLLNDELRTAAAAFKEQITAINRSVIWIAASTHQGEDEIILDAFAQVRSRCGDSSLLLILVPRHPERFERVGQLCESRGFKVARRSQGRMSSAMDILLGDTMGELMLLFGASDIAFMGGSLVPNGGHNFIEPAAWGLPLLSGEYVFNFAEVSCLMLDANALQIVLNAHELAAAIQELIGNEVMRQQRGANALRVALDNRGALDKTLEIISQSL